MVVMRVVLARRCDPRDDAACREQSGAAELALFLRALEQLAHARELGVRELALLHELSEQLDRRAAVDLVEHSTERALPRHLGVDHGVIDVGLSLPAAVRDVALHLERPDHRGHARVRERRIDALPHLVRGGFAELPEDAHDIQLALGQMEVRHRARRGCEASSPRASRLTTARRAEGTCTSTWRGIAPGKAERAGWRRAS